MSTTLGPADAPPAVWPVPESDRFAVTLAGGVRTVFTPAYRHAANDRRLPGVREGYDIIAKSATVIGHTLADFRVEAVFTVIPTKELVYAPALRQARIATPAAYEALVADEARNLEQLASRLRGMRKGRYVDLLAPLQAAARGGNTLYAADIDGHPAAGGHDVIARAIAAELEPPRR